MNKEKTLQILKILISSCRNLALFNESLNALGIDIRDSTVFRVMDQLTDGVHIISGLEDSDMRGDDIIEIMLSTEFEEKQMLEKLIGIFGDEVLE